MPRSSKKKQAAHYDSGLLTAFAVIGILLIAMGLLSLLSIVAGLRGSVFSFIKQMMQGIGGGLCVGVSIWLLWLGVLVVMSTSRSMPKRAFLLVTLLFVAVTGIINLLSKVGTYNLMEYLAAMNRRQQPPVASPDSYRHIISACFELCKSSGAFGGALGMLLAWPAWTFLGTVLGVVALGVICLLCLLLVSRFDLMQVFEGMRSGAAVLAEKRRQKKEQAAYAQQQAEQQRQAEEAERLRLTPAYLRRDSNATPPMYPPYGNLPDMQSSTGFLQPPVTPPQGEMYDEIIIPQNQAPTWHKGGKSKKQNSAQTNETDYQTRMSFTPSEMGQEAGETQLDDTLILFASRKKALERIESMRKRKAQLDEKIAQNERAREAAHPTFAPAVSAQPVQEPPKTAPQSEPAPAQREESAQPAEQPRDRNAAYRRPETPAPQEPATKASSKPGSIPYVYPSIDLLNAQPRQEMVDTHAVDAQNAAQLEETLESFGIPARVQRVTHGPAVTRFELGLTSSGVNVKRIMSIADNIAMDMASNGGVRIEIPIPGTNLFGIEVPNREIRAVTLGEVLMSPEMRSAKSPLAVALGHDIAGRPIICDIAKMPHLLIAGQTGSGKSVCINAIINSLLFRSSPEEVRMIMIDPKVVELQCYNVVPHLLIPVVSDPHKAAGALQWAVAEMIDRYHKMTSKHVREISAYNAKLGPDEEKLPRIVIIIDELADLMLACKKEVEESIIRIAQLARAAGIHLIVATQRPTVDVITGLIKANVPSRIAFAVSSSIDSRTILDQNGAEKLLGKGDMFYFPSGAGSPMRVQGCFLSDAEIERVVDYIGANSHVDFDPNVIEALENEDEAVNPLSEQEDTDTVDDRLAEAIDMVITDGQASISMLQRRMKIGYARAGRLIDDMAARGIVSKSAGSKPREVLMSREEYEKIKNTLL